MTPERADEINAALVSHSMYAMELRTEPPPSLAGIGLEEMIMATRMVQTEDEAKSGPGSRIRIVCADRLIAALYVLANYQACDAQEVAESVANNERAGVFVILISSQPVNQLTQDRR